MSTRYFFLSIKRFESEKISLNKTEDFSNTLKIKYNVTIKILSGGHSLIFVLNEIDIKKVTCSTLFPHYRHLLIALFFAVR